MTGGRGVSVGVRPPGWISKQAGPFEQLASWVGRAEQLGFDSVFVGDRLLAQASKAQQVVYGASMLDATMVLAALAARTERIQLGPLVLVFPYRHPIQLAKTLASLDVISGGRLIVGAGIGWNQREFEALGIPTAGRGEEFELQLAAVRGFWRGERYSYRGTRWEFDEVEISPLPVRSGGPPVWIASFSPGHALDWSSRVYGPEARVLDRVGRLADGWVPLIYSASSKRRLDADVLGDAWQRVLQSAEAEGRGREDMDFVFSDWCFVIGDTDGKRRCQQALERFFAGDWDDALRTYTIGSVDEIVEKIRAHTASVDRVDSYILTPLGGDPDQLELLVGVAERLRL